MKSLLPLRLLSASLPETNFWPSSTPNNRSTFGMNIGSVDEGEDKRSLEELNEDPELESKAKNHRPKPYRDVPIYSEPGSPLLNRAYLTDQEAHSNCSTSESEEWFEVYDYLGMEPETSDCVDESSTIKVVLTLSLTTKSKADLDQGPLDDEVEDDLKTSSGPGKDRSSGMSFQCSGEAEALFSNEAAWLRSPLSYHRPTRISRLPLRSSSVPFEQNIESWLSDTSSCGDDEEDSLVSLIC
jgi:hypothetical protein